jgi:pyridoxine 5-phosphate synthase
VEIHTGAYANAKTGAERSRELKKVAESAALARTLGLRVNAGHGLDYYNVGDIVRIPEIEELNIGFSVIARAVLAGIRAAVSEMKKAMAL